MCNYLFLSTTTNEDLSLRSADSFRIRRATEEDLQLLGNTLTHSNVWYIVSRYGGCSCHYRHLMYENVEGMGFSEPQDWFGEDEDDIESTRAIYGVLADLVKSGNQVDLIDFWAGDDPADHDDLVVSIDAVPPEKFRFFEGHHFEFVP